MLHCMTSDQNFFNLIDHYEKWLLSLSAQYSNVREALVFLYGQVFSKKMEDLSCFDGHIQQYSESYAKKKTDHSLLSLTKEQWCFRLVCLLKHNGRLKILPYVLKNLFEKPILLKTATVTIESSRELSQGELEKIMKKISQESDFVCTVQSVVQNPLLKGGIIVHFDNGSQWDASRNRKFQLLYQSLSDQL